MKAAPDPDELCALALEWRHATDAERDRAVQSACAFAAQALASRPDREKILAYRDPLPKESAALLARLRREQRIAIGRGERSE